MTGSSHANRYLMRYAGGVGTLGSSRLTTDDLYTVKMTIEIVAANTSLFCETRKVAKTGWGGKLKGDDGRRL